MERSTKPFSVVLWDLLEEQDISLRELTRRCQRHGQMSLTVMSKLGRGELPPTLENMEVIAKALKVRPQTFAEYRLDSVRHRLNHREVGLAKALRFLGSLEARSARR